MITCDYLIVGAGITGITAANILSHQKNKKVVLVEKRNHIGGNCYDCLNEDGILIHLYGPHIFHTNHKDVWDYLSRFAEWNNYIHHVKAFVDGKHITFPININTFEQLFEKSFTKQSMLEYLENEKIDLPEITNAEEMVISRMGRTIYEKFFKNYTRKQWGIDAKNLDPEITARIPIRFDRDDRFFTDQYQGLPKDGYTRMFENMLNHKNIKLLLKTAYKDIIHEIEYDKIIFTGPVDEFFDYKFGRLPYRGINFSFKTVDTQHAIPAAVVNYPNDHDYTRVTEFKRMTLQANDKTSLCYEFPADTDGSEHSPVPSYPILNQKTSRQHYQYVQEALNHNQVIFMGRLGRFEYLNMDVCVKTALKSFSE